ncbi:2-oxo acid dehydrogenase subunit E2 [Buchnera aphidicola]|nr:2-oxo acid dehydrogenase subunit E2 [Buchnera aphidicola]
MHNKVKMPDIGLDEVEVIEILVKVGEKVQLEQGLITVEGDKTSMEIPSPVSGIVKEINVNIGDKVTTSCLIMTCISEEFNQDNKEIIPLKSTAVLMNTNINKHKEKKLIHATPVVRRLARHLNINLQDITGSGRKNRILKQDLELYKKKYSEIRNTSDLKNNNLNNLKLSQTHTIPITNLQKVVGKNLHKNWLNIPHVTQLDEVNITLLEDFRKQYNHKEHHKNGEKYNITLLVFIIKAVAHALKKFPIFNSSLSVNKNEIILKKYINIGIAVDVPEGLLVPVIKDVDKKNIVELSSELIALSKKAHDNKLTKSDMMDGCFTISNLGGIGGSWFFPIINAPEVAILGVSRAVIKPFWNGKEFNPSLILPLSLSYDHRIINGADAARFITFIRKLLSDIRFLIM